MNPFRILFPKPTKQSVLEKLAYYEAKYKKAVEHEKLHKYINHSLLRDIESMAGKIAKLKAMLSRFE